jgi:hypothetical protein
MQDLINHLTKWVKTHSNSRQDTYVKKVGPHSIEIGWTSDSVGEIPHDIEEFSSQGGRELERRMVKEYDALERSLKNIPHTFMEVENMGDGKIVAVVGLDRSVKQAKTELLKSGWGFELYQPEFDDKTSFVVDEIKWSKAKLYVTFLAKKAVVKDAWLNRRDVEVDTKANDAYFTELMVKRLNQRKKAMVIPDTIFQFHTEIGKIPRHFGEIFKITADTSSTYVKSKNTVYDQVLTNVRITCKVEIFEGIFVGPLNIVNALIFDKEILPVWSQGKPQEKDQIQDWTYDHIYSLSNVMQLQAYVTYFPANHKYGPMVKTLRDNRSKWKGVLKLKPYKYDPSKVKEPEEDFLGFLDMRMTSLGYSHPQLRNHIRPILAKIRTASPKGSLQDSFHTFLDKVEEILGKDGTEVVLQRTMFVNRKDATLMYSVKKGQTQEIVFPVNMSPKNFAALLKKQLDKK